MQKKTETQIGVICLETKEGEGLLTPTRSQEVSIEHVRGFRKNQLCWQLDLGPLAS